MDQVGQIDASTSKKMMRQLSIIILLFLRFTSFGQDQHSSESNNNIRVTDPMPSFPGGFDSLRTFIKKNLKYPKGTTDYVGVVYVAFTVREDGSTTDFKVVRGLCEICDTNAIETLKKMPKWTPAVTDDTPTRISIIVPVKHEL